MRAKIITPSGDELVTTTNRRYVLISDAGFMPGVGARIVKRSDNPWTLNADRERIAVRYGGERIRLLHIYDTHTYVRCFRSGQHSDSYPGDRDQCEGCGAIALTRKDGTYQTHKRPAMLWFVRR